ncbi:hypothetical protein [Ammoniphilus sp. 3BR4]|uniref:hypothetical protein n=1 Tax=Ammoniphilus sp. 3BR4 TaxID=3158265 RepID=UPI003465E80C
MTTWLSLTKKELRLGMLAFLFPLIAFLLITSVAYYIGSQYGYQWEAVLGVAIFISGFQAFYLVYYLFFSLRSERKKLHLWLHNPMTGSSLLSSKVVAGLISMLITQAIIGITLLLALHLSANIPKPVPWSIIIDFGLFSAVQLFVVAISFASWFLFYWGIYRIIASKLGTFLSILSTFIIVIATRTLYNWLLESPLYERLTMWGQFQATSMIEAMNFIQSLEYSPEMMIDTEPFSLYLGAYVMEGVMVVLLFFVASWILDRKVEV